MSLAEDNDGIPLCVNCEYALLKTNILHEAVLLLFRKSPHSLFELPTWILRGPAELARRLCGEVSVNWRHVPVNDGVVQCMRAALAANRQIFVLTSMPRTWAIQLCAELGFPQVTVIDSDSATGTPGGPGPALAGSFGARGFDYIGDGRHDLPLCQKARGVLLVSSSDRAIARAKGCAAVTAVIPTDTVGIPTFLKMIRVHQWLKNFLVLVPLIAAHRLTAAGSIRMAAVAFMAFSFCASSVYVLNDLLDLESDRQHLRKRARPIAAGKIKVGEALIADALLLATAACLALSVSTLFAIAVGIYFVMTLAYSLRLKRQVIVDVMLLAGLYTMRVLAGAVATLVVPSFWLLAFSMFLFLSLAMVKRYSEMLVTLAEERHEAAGRGYSVNDLPVLLSLGVSAGMAAIVVLALYINDPATGRLYPSTIWLWPIPPLMLYWISRVWMKAHRGEMHDDPVLFAVRDWQSLLTVVVGGLCFAAASN